MVRSSNSKKRKTNKNKKQKDEQKNFLLQKLQNREKVIMKVVCLSSSFNNEQHLANLYFIYKYFNMSLTTKGIVFIMQLQCSHHI